MANEQYAFIHKDKVPAGSEWQEAVDAAGFDLRIDPGLKVFEHSGFLPCVLFGQDSGVETYYSPAKRVLDDAAVLEELAGDRDYCITFRWGGRLEEAACAMILSYALASSFGALVSYEGEAPYEDLVALRKDTEAIIKQATKKRRT
jgi:hypothetical protein